MVVILLQGRVRKHVVAWFSAERKYQAMVYGVRKLFWLKNLLSELRVEVSLPMKLHCDNIETILVPTNPVYDE